MMMLSVMLLMMDGGMTDTMRTMMITSTIDRWGMDSMTHGGMIETMRTIFQGVCIGGMTKTMRTVLMKYRGISFWRAGYHAV